MSNIPEEKIIEGFVEQSKIIAEEWTRAIADGKDPVHKYADQIFHLHQTLKSIIKK